MKNHLRRLHACISYTNYKTTKLQKDFEIGELMEMGDEVVEVPQDVSMNKKDQLDTNVMPVTKISEKIRILTSIWRLNIQKSSVVIVIECVTMKKNL